MTQIALDPSQINEGMTVLSSEGERIGTVKDVNAREVVVERAQRLPDLHVPLAFVRYTAGTELALTIPASKVDEMHWETPR